MPSRPDSKKIHIDIDRSSINKTVPVDCHPAIAQVLEQLIEAWGSAQGAGPDRMEGANASRLARAQRLGFRTRRGRRSCRSCGRAAV
jgi:thiamine pyrophosphate-dependent acetolactate synthase large subunit-like protein